MIRAIVRVATSRVLPLVVILAVIRGLAGAQADPAPAPHIVIVLVDDLGWGEVGYHGGMVKTPNIDRLAERGVRLETVYGMPTCTPSRSSLLTGRYPIRYGFHVGGVRPWSTNGLPTSERTLAQALGEVGYRTAICGKWHLGHAELKYRPLQRGFDHAYGHYCGMIDYNTHRRLNGLDWHRNGVAVEERGYSTNLIAEECVRLIDGHTGDQPLFLYVPFNAVHAPYKVDGQWTVPYRHIPNRVSRFRAGMIACMDHAIGHVIEALDRKGMTESTLVLFLSDNGGPDQPAGERNGLFRGGKNELYEGGVRVPAVAVWPGHIPAGSVVEAPLHLVDFYPTLLELADGNLEQELPIDGRDVWRALVGEDALPDREILINATKRRGALRQGTWKLVARELESDAPQYELYDLETDPRESTNLATEHPERRAAMFARLLEHLAEAAPSIAAGAQPSGFRAPAVWGE